MSMETTTTQHTETHEDTILAFVLGERSTDRPELIHQIVQCNDCMTFAYALTGMLPVFEKAARAESPGLAAVPSQSPESPRLVLVHDNTRPPVATSASARLELLLKDVMLAAATEDRQTDRTHVQKGGKVVDLASRRKSPIPFTLWAVAAAMVLMVGGIVLYRANFSGGFGSGPTAQRVSPQVSVVSNEVLGDPDVKTSVGTDVVVTARETVRLTIPTPIPLAVPTLITLWIAETEVVWATDVDEATVSAAAVGKEITLHLKKPDQQERSGVIVTLSRDKTMVSAPAAVLKEYGDSLTLWWAVSDHGLTPDERKRLSLLSDKEIQGDVATGIRWLVGPTRVQQR